MFQQNRKLFEKSNQKEKFIRFSNTNCGQAQIMIKQTAHKPNKQTKKKKNGKLKINIFSGFLI